MPVLSRKPDPTYLERLDSKKLDRKQTKHSTETIQPAQTSEFVDAHCYLRAEKRANWYLKELQQLIDEGSLFNQLKEDYSNWRHQSDRFIYQGVSLSELETEQHIGGQLDSMGFLKKLSADRKLRKYLEKSVSYIFMRDLGKSLQDKSTKKNIDDTVTRLHRWIKKQVNKDSKNSALNDSFSSNLLFGKAKDNGVEKTLYWLMGKLGQVQGNMPEELDQTNGMRKLVKIIAGVVLHQFISQPQSGSSEAETSKQNKKEGLDSAIRLGYSYGLTYPFIDDLQDSASVLNDEEKEVFNQAIRQSLLQGKVVEFPQFSKKNQRSMTFVYQELSEAFDYIRDCRSPHAAKTFFEQAFIFFEAQDIDRRRTLSSKKYTIEELFLPIILKSAGCRLIARELLNSQSDEAFNYHTFCFGIYNQFNDDIKDIFIDLDEGNVTPYTYYLQQIENVEGVAFDNNKELINPYEVYWSVVFYLIYEVYKNEPFSKKLLLERSINAHKSLKASIGENDYQLLRQKLLTTGDASFDRLIDELVEQPNDIAWFDKLISRHVAEHFDKQKQQQAHFKSRFEEVRRFVDECLPVANHKKLNQSTLIEAANYSLNAGGKRLRATLAYVICVDKYGFSPAQIKPILQLLEYMHTASIIFDDKPSQDNSDLRRGHVALHKQYNCEATAELTAVFMMMRAVEVQSNLKEIPPERVLESLSYASSITQAICEGQLLDLKSTERLTNLAELETISELKTGLAIEASLMIPAILAGENDIERGHIKEFSKHLGLAFQIKDDLLDHCGDSERLGKPTFQDADLGKASFVTCLGEEQAKQKLFEHFFLAQEALESLPEIKPFMGQVLDFVVHRSS
ncbi:polyprenyl synthetase family protein [Aliikangiella coralliicola]|uniref:Polyprenyl synthetase family protein n=1 Tax=Aliikangiella coralliicola TaxID=2592383 RepID=A0A545U7C9_9GAMM|nr:polyprenyl synthetase family protein [Aliikangiella coralliicola]TQV85372.1 polyprenyl synthetase family protein [Aliikangiella coralliicola]